MSFVFSKNKEKRSRSSTGETNSSFVKKVTSRMSGLLPAGITKWFSSPSSSSGNGSAAVADGTDSSTEDEAPEPESPSMIQPPAKRIRYSSPVGKYSQLTTSETTTTSSVITESGSVLYSSIQSPHGRNTFKREPNFVSTPIRIHDTTTERSDVDDQFIHHAVPAIDQSVTAKRKSLFNSARQKESSVIACAKTAASQIKEKPYFKPHLLGSPFYPGRTMYGGASASSTYMNQPNIMHRKMTYVNESKDTESAMSSSTRRVMDLLENYSSPLIEAKRIPRYELSELRDINRSLPLSTSTKQRDNNSYKTQELYIPTKASLIRMNARNRLMESTKAARQIIASHSSTHLPQKPYPVESSKTDRSNIVSSSAKSQTKLKSRLTRINRGENAFEMPENVELPSAVLQIDKNKLPKISFGAGPDALEKATQTHNEPFKFSSPLQASPDANIANTRASSFNFDSPEKAVENKTPPKFSFGEQALDAASKTEPVVPEEKEEPAKTSTDKTVITFTNSIGVWKCSDCWVSNTAEALSCGCCGGKRPSKQKPKSPSVVTSKCYNCKLANSQPNSDRCVNCEKMQASTKPTKSLHALVAKKANSSKWKCGECWVENEKSIEKCLCCGSRNPQGPSTPVPGANQSAVAPLPLQRDWRCEDCFITNKPTTEKCAACNGAKPGTKPDPKTLMASTNALKPDNKMADIIRAQLSYWECKICLASNDNEKPVCMCCDAPRNPQESKPSIFTNFKFNADVSSTFKFGIDPKVQETNMDMKVDEPPEPNNTEESETNNNVVPKYPSFGLTFPAAKQTDFVACTKTDEEPKPSFSFGIPRQNVPHVVTGFAPITAPAGPKLPDIVNPTEEKEKPQEVPSISFKAPERSATKRSIDPFASSAKPQNAMNAFLNNSTETKTSSPTKSKAVLDAPQFSFSASPAKPNTGNLFTLPASTALTNSSTTQAATGSSLTMDMFSKPEVSVAPSTGFFTKPETTPAAPSSTLFQSNVPSGPAAPAPAPAPAPTTLFSFGNNQSATAAPTNEVKKFNFTFNSKNTTPTFGATPQTNSNFSIPAGKQLTNANSANSLGGNGISMAGNDAVGGNGGNSLMPSGNGMLGPGSASMFDAATKENTSMWPSTTEQTNQGNPFMASAPAKPFAFGATQAPAPFGAQPANPQQPQMFGASAQPAQNTFGMNQNNGSQPSMFGNPVANQPAPMFGAHNTNPAPGMGMFGQPSASPFGAPATAPTQPTFNFGGQQASPVVFGFGQQPQQAVCMPSQPAMQAMDQPQVQGMQQAGMQQPGMQQPGMQQPGMQQPGMQLPGMQQPGMQQPGMFFGANAPGQMQFAIGSAPANTGARRLRKAFRRTQQR